MHLRCPHCQNPIELADLPSGGEITCAGCGSSFQMASFSTATWDGAVNKRMGKFEVIGAVGHGAFGTVLRAHDTELDRIVAIKVPRASNIGPGPEDVDRFLREARAVAQLRFPSIISIHEVGTDNGTPYLVSDFVEGITLADHLTGRGFSFTESAKLLADVADALQYAHSLGVVHRDVKPSNIMIRPDGSPCVMDFGLAKRDAGEITMTIDGQILGTPAYMSPEQARGESHKVDGRSDVYSLGVILYQLLTGELPFRGNKSMLLHQVLHEEPRALRTLNDKIPRDLETIALKAMAKEPRRRYACAKEMADDLRRWLAGEAILARPVGAVERLWRWCKRKPALATANAAVVLAFAMVVVGFFVVRESLNQEQIERGNAERQANVNKMLAADNQKLASKEKHLRVEAEELAKLNKKLAIDVDERRERAETLMTQMGFNNFYAKSKENDALALVGTAQLLPQAARLKDRRLFDSMKLHLSGWVPETELRWIGTHGGPIPNLVGDLSADGKIALTGSYDKTARLWDMATGKQIGPPLQHQDAVVAAVLSADGKIALTGSLDKTARLWETATGKPIGPPLSHKSSITAVALSADGKIALTGSWDKTARLWETASGKPIGPPLPFQGELRRALALSANGTIAVTGSGAKNAQLWETATGNPIGPPLWHQGEVYAVALSADGKIALTGSQDFTAQLWHTATGKLIGSRFQHEDKVLAVALSADGRTALTGSADKTARLWNTATGKPIGPPLQHQDGVTRVALSADGEIALTGSGHTARLWEATTGKPIGPHLLHPTPVRVLALTADAQSVLTGSGHTARLWETATANPNRRRLLLPERVRAVALSTDGKAALTVCHDHTAWLWQTATGRPLGPPLQLGGAVRALAFSADGKSVLTGSVHIETPFTTRVGKTAQLWEAATGKPIGASLQHQGAVPAVAFSADGKTAITGSDDKTARLWETATGKPIGMPLNHQSSVFHVALSADGKYALTVSTDKAMRLWETTTGRPIGPLIKVEGVRALALSADGKTALTGSMNKTAILWDTATGKFKRPILHQGYVMAVCLSADGKIALTGSEDRTAYVLEAATGKPIGPTLQHQAPVRAVALSADGRIALTGCEDKTARLWETATGKPIGPPLHHQGDFLAVALSANGMIVLTGSGDYSARLWKLPQWAEDPERVALWAQVITGMEVDEDGTPRAFDAAEWHERRARLEKLGGPPFD